MAIRETDQRIFRDDELAWFQWIFAAVQLLQSLEEVSLHTETRFLLKTIFEEMASRPGLGCHIEHSEDARDQFLQHTSDDIGFTLQEEKLGLPARALMRLNLAKGLSDHF